MTRFNLAFIVILVTASLGFAQAVTVKDLRKKDSKSTKAVVLCAREDGVGHAFVVLGKEDEKKRMCTVEAFGFYPEEKGSKAVFMTVPGKLSDEFIRGKGLMSDHSLILQVDDDQFDAVEKVRSEWAKKKPDYKLLSQNCISFTTEAAKAIGLEVPNGKSTDTPPAFLKALIEKNK